MGMTRSGKALGSGTTTAVSARESAAAYDSQWAQLPRICTRPKLLVLLDHAGCFYNMLGNGSSRSSKVKTCAACNPLSWDVGPSRISSSCLNKNISGLPLAEDEPLKRSRWPDLTYRPTCSTSELMRKDASAFCGGDTIRLCPRARHLSKQFRGRKNKHTGSCDIDRA